MTKRANHSTLRGVEKQSFIGGLRWNGFNATTPFAGLTLDDKGVTIRLIGIVRARHPYSEVTQAERIVGGMLGSPGVRITFATGQRCVFWAFNPRRVLAAFRDRGVPVIDEGKPPRIGLGT